ncbi:purine nucleoside permease-like protein [Flagelloscypha sp. PMI_526]|nr:purine nucleoside permease-like protein [Flagelloscypha sp. PMI_526]
MTNMAGCFHWVSSVFLVRLSFFFVVLANPILPAVQSTSLIARTRRIPLQPKVFIIAQYGDERDIWRRTSYFDVFAQEISFPGSSPIFSKAFCTSSAHVCLVTVGEGEIQAAISIANLLSSNIFDLEKTYWLVGGCAGINPKLGTVGSVTFAKYAVQVALQYEFDARDMPDEFEAGYVPFGSYNPDDYPQTVYGTEVYELNDNLRQLAIAFAKRARLNDTSSAQALRANYGSSVDFAAGATPPAVIACDTATSDNWFTGNHLAEAFERATRLFTNGHGVYCTTQQEDNATLEALLRGALSHVVDFSRIVILRTGSDFDRPYPGSSTADNLFYAWDGYDPAIENIAIAGGEVVKGILEGWTSTFEKGVLATNYVGNIFGSLGGSPDFGEESVPDGVNDGRRGRRRRKVSRP